jgi:DNA-binding MarR family transcriptional regulator
LNERTTSHPAPESGSAGEPSPDGFAPDPAGEFPFNPVDYLFHLQGAVGRLRDAQIEPGLNLLDLNVARYRVLTVIGRLGACTMSELAMLSAVDRTTLTRAIDQLIEANLVQRQRDTTDRRKVVVVLSAEGDALRRRADAFVCNHGRYLLEGVGEGTMREFIRLAQMLVARLAPDAAAARAILAFHLGGADTPAGDDEGERR